MQKSFIERHAPSLLTIALLIVWELVCRIFKVDPFVLPMPTAIWDSLLEFKKPIFDHAAQTFWTTMVGFAIAVAVGVILGCLLGSSALVYRACYPLLVGFNSIRHGRAGQNAQADHRSIQRRIRRSIEGGRRG